MKGGGARVSEFFVHFLKESKSKKTFFLFFRGGGGGGGGGIDGRTGPNLFAPSASS